MNMTKLERSGYGIPRERVNETEMQRRQDERLKTALLILLGLAMFGLALAFVLFLNSGCELTGVVTWEGKACM